MTYKVSSGTLSLYSLLITHCYSRLLDAPLLQLRIVFGAEVTVVLDVAAKPRFFRLKQSTLSP